MLDHLYEEQIRTSQQRKTTTIGASVVSIAAIFLHSVGLFLLLLWKPKKKTKKFFTPLLFFKTTSSEIRLVPRRLQGFLLPFPTK